MNPDAPAGSSNGATGDRETEADRQATRDADQTALDADQTLSDVDQSAADTDQVAADSDRTASQRDQALAAADQRASNHDQLAAERDLAEGPPADAARQHAHDISLEEREASTVERAANAVVRAQLAAERLDAADRRDEASTLRDLAAQARDHAAEARDLIAAKSEPVGPAAEARVQAAADRERAAADRAQAASDRREVRMALSEAHVDELTGTYRRGLGTLAIQKEINRARHSGGRLVLAFVDVDGLKEVNDREGHAAGDALLIDVATTIRSKLRSYDPVVRFGGDEFVCAFADFDLEGVHRRFDEIQSALDAAREDSSISVGLAELQSDDTLEDLTARGDAALYEAKRAKRGDNSADGHQRPSGAGVGEPGPRQRLGFLRLRDRRYLRLRGPGRSGW